MASSIQVRAIGGHHSLLRKALLRKGMGTYSVLLLSASLLNVGGLRAADTEDDFPVPAGLPALTIPKNNPMTKAKVELGKQLYFDKRLSIDNTVSCASCHDPKKGWSNDDATAEGTKSQRGGRSSPTVINSAYSTFQFWDGRAGSLEEQATGPIMNPIEMSMPSADIVEKKINDIPGYRKQFQEVFGGPATLKNIGLAIAAFERTVLSGDAPYDRFVAGDKKALSPAAQRGFELFKGKAHCSACHTGHSFTDNAFHNLGVNIHKGDKGREAISKMEGDRGAFKTPTLREIARTAPYMHDGEHKTLEEVIEYYNKGGTPNPQLDEEIYPLELTNEEIKDLVIFLKEGLSSSKYPDIAPPKLPE